MYTVLLDTYSRISTFPLQVCYVAWREENRHVHAAIPIQFISICFTLGIESMRYSVDWSGTPLTITQGQPYMKIAYPGDTPVTVEKSTRREFFLYYKPQSRGVFDLFGLQSGPFVRTERFDRTLEEIHGLVQAAETPGNSDALDRLCLELAFEAQISTKLRSDRCDPLPHVFRAEAYLKVNFSSKIDFEEIARANGMGLRTFYREWEKFFATTPLQYVTRLRLEKATELLAKPGLRIFEVAELSGFASAIYFDRCFQRYYHLTPSEYRASLQQGA